MRVRAERPGDPALAARLAAHPMVDLIDGPNAPEALAFWQGEWRRTVSVASPAEVRGLIELMDNNPLVCADGVSVPSPGGTLALVALGPLARANLLLEAPVVRLTEPADGESIGQDLATEGWTGGIVLQSDDVELAGVVAVHAIAEIPTPERWEEIDELYDEAFGRSLYVVVDEASEWHVDLVRGTPRAVLRVACTTGEGRSLLTVRAMADRDGKCGSAQIVHAMNLMAGFEESLGIG